jgi:peptidoglycan/xylan/chitin deacetylase (PgdA/CDA1 family)
MVPAIVLAVIAILALSHVAPFPFLFDAAAGKLCIWRVSLPAPEKLVYLTFDDGPNLSATPQLLDLLRGKGVRATFFLIDGYVDARSAPIVRRMFEEGHTVGLHSSDRWLMTKSSEALARKLRAAADRIELYSGYRPAPLFRPHAGRRSVSMLVGLSRLNYRLVGWSWMAWDWCWFRERTAERVASQVISHAAPGKIIVIHDGHHKNREANRLYAIHATRLIIDGLRSRGFEFATLSDAP